MKTIITIALAAVLAACGAGNPDEIRNDPRELACSASNPQNCPPPPSRG